MAIASAPIPFRGSFGHASALREHAENVLVQVEDEDGNYGLGEGCPRPYVTGETAHGARAFLDRHRGEFLELDGIAPLRQWMERRSAEIDANPSAFCAAELALLDLFSRQQQKSVESLLGIPLLHGGLSATAVYSTGSWAKFCLTALLFAAYGMREAKLKVSGQVRVDGRRAAFLARRGRVRLDANNLWPSAEAAVAGLSHAAVHAWAVEEPVGPRDWHGMREVADRTGLAIILDESFTCIQDLDEAPADPSFIVNLRVSKLGGLLRSLAALRHSLGQGRSVILGCQVGETSILARAGLAIASAAGDRLIGYEGAYGTRLLTEDAVSPSIAFGWRGSVDLSRFPVSETGLGLRPTPVFQKALLNREAFLDS
ncbi:MAG TPA: enolase C-terminal domain-like protein [Alphaproteobacteria bacterium]|nr:enolase C-terminal domain-like protein [Alphaproteobacteria bacterium]